MAAVLEEVQTAGTQGQAVAGRSPWALAGRQLWRNRLTGPDCLSVRDLVRHIPNDRGRGSWETAAIPIIGLLQRGSGNGEALANN